MRCPGAPGGPAGSRTPGPPGSSSFGCLDRLVPNKVRFLRVSSVKRFNQLPLPVVPFRVEKSDVQCLQIRVLRFKARSPRSNIIDIGVGTSADLTFADRTFAD